MSETGYRRALMVGIAAMVALIGAFVLRGTLWPDRMGPRLPAQSGDTVWLLSHGALHQFDAGGRRINKIDWAELPLSDTASALQFTAPDVFWTHDQSRVQRCTLSTRRCDVLALPELSTRRDYRWIRVSDDARELTVSDASEHRILVYRRSADNAPFTLARAYTQGLRFPNQTLAVNGQLWVANTNEHAITQLDAQDATRAPLGNFPVNNLALRAGHRFPFAMQRDHLQRLWVLVADPTMGNADLLRLDADLKPDRVVPLDAKQDPNALLWTGKELLATDMTRFRVDRISSDGQPLGTFGDAAFLAELDAARADHAWGQRLPSFLMGAIALLVLLCTWLGWKAGEFRKIGGARWQKPSPAPVLSPVFAPAPVLERPVATAAAQPIFGQAPARGALTRVRAQPGATARRRQILVAMGAMGVLVVAASVYWAWPYFYQHDCGPYQGCDPTGMLRSSMLLAVVFLALVYGLSWRYLRQLESTEIATNGEQLAVRTGSGKRYKRPADQVTLTRQHLLIGPHSVPLRVNGSPLFDEAKLQRDIFARLPQMQVLDGAWDMGWLKHQWRHGGWRGRATVVVLWLAGLAILTAQVLRLVRLATG